MSAPLRLMVYDRSFVGRRTQGPLTLSWIAGGLLYGGLGRLDAWTGATTWSDALDWLGRFRDDRPIGAIQYWGHGNWGTVRVADERLDARSLAAGQPLRPALERIRERMTPEAEWWFRTCDTFGSARGHAFAQRWTDFFGRPAAAFTHVIGPWQSGLHRLRPGVAPHWPASEGLSAGTPEAPLKSTMSGPSRPNTVSCLAGTVPQGW